MAMQAEHLLVEPVIGIPDRMAKSRHHCGIKSAEVMAAKLTERLGNRIEKPIGGSTVSAWEAGTNQPTMIRVEDLIPVWVDICNEHGAPLGRSTSVEFIYGIRTGSFAPMLQVLPMPTGQGTLLDDEGEPVDFHFRAALMSV